MTVLRSSSRLAAALPTKALRPFLLLTLGVSLLASCQPQESPNPLPEAQAESGQEIFQDGFEQGAPTATVIEATSLLGEPLYRREPSAEVAEKQGALLAEAEARLEQEPDSTDAWIWVGRRLAYLGRYQDSIEHYSRGLERFRGSPFFLRHRGHRYITTRQLELAEADLNRAATAKSLPVDDVVEQDGLPNANNVPTSSLFTNIYYHLGLAHYLQGEWDQALDAYRRCLEFSTNPDMEIATRYWLYLTLRRAGRDAEARELAANIPAELELLESGDYHRLLLLYRGDLSEDEVLGSTGSDEGAAVADLSSATIGYGVGTHRLISGDSAGAEQIYRRVVASPSWAPFGYIAAEAELARMQ